MWIKSGLFISILSLRIFMKQSIHYVISRFLDCFVTLAMTVGIIIFHRLLLVNKIFFVCFFLFFLSGNCKVKHKLKFKLNLLYVHKLCNDSGIFKGMKSLKFFCFTFGTKSKEYFKEPKKDYFSHFIYIWNTKNNPLVFKDFNPLSTNLL